MHAAEPLAASCGGVRSTSLLVASPHNIAGGDDNIAGGDARRKFWIKPLKETDLGVAQAFLTPKRDHVKTQTMYIHFYIFHVHGLSETFTAKYDGVLPRTP